jgi:chitinase
MKTLLSIGGWTYSSNFAAPAATAEGRRTFAKSAVGLLADLGFDGIDIDWEYPQNDAEARNFVLLLEETRKELSGFSQAYLGGKQLLLTVAAPCGSTHYSKLRMADMDRYLDFWNLMCYDFAGSWDSTAGHQANVFPSQQNPSSTPFDADSAIRAYVAGGVQPGKIVFGLPLYGRAFENTKGPGHSFQGTGEGSWENGVWDYKALPHEGATEHSDPQLLASWSYSPAQGKLVSYDTPEIATRKAQYIRDKGLGGGMWWELSGDHPVSHPRSLVKTTVQAFGGPASLDRTENTLTYPTSKYDNVRNGFK